MKTLCWSVRAVAESQVPGRISVTSWAHLKFLLHPSHSSTSHGQNKSTKQNKVPSSLGCSACFVFGTTLNSVCVQECVCAGLYGLGLREKGATVEITLKAERPSCNRRTRAVRLLYSPATGSGKSIQWPACSAAHDSHTSDQGCLLCILGMQHFLEDPQQHKLPVFLQALSFQGELKKF